MSGDKGDSANGRPRLRGSSEINFFRKANVLINSTVFTLVDLFSEKIYF